VDTKCWDQATEGCLTLNSKGKNVKLWDDGAQWQWE
jgi:hypothetical protein